MANMLLCVATSVCVNYNQKIKRHITLTRIAKPKFKHLCNKWTEAASIHEKKDIANISETW